MVVNLKVQMESYSNDELMHTLANEQESPIEVVNIARSIVLERGLSHRNIMDRSQTLKTAKKEAKRLLAKDRSALEIVGHIRDKYFLEEDCAKIIVESAHTQINAAGMLRCFRFFMFGFMLFYTVRIFAKVL